MNNLKDQDADFEKPELVDADSVSLIKPSSTDHPLYPDIVDAVSYTHLTLPTKA